MLDQIFYEDDFENEEDYRNYIKVQLKQHVLQFMEDYKIGIGSSFFATIMRQLADYVDD